jgi:hypothetical protein
MTSSAVGPTGFLAVLDLEQLAAELLPAPGFLPQLLRLDGRHQQLDGAAGVHLLAHCAFDLAQHAQAQRGPGVQAGRELADHAGLEHQLVADDLGVGRGFLGSVEVELRQAHRRGFTRREAVILPWVGRGGPWRAGAGRAQRGEVIAGPPSQ